MRVDRTRDSNDLWNWQRLYTKVCWIMIVKEIVKSFIMLYFKEEIKLNNRQPRVILTDTPHTREEKVNRLHTKKNEILTNSNIFFFL